MKVILFMAMSANGLIARPDGEEDFLSHANWESFTELVDQCQNLIVGRKTYEAVKQWEENYSFDDFSAVKVVLTRDQAYALDAGYKRAATPEEALAILRSHGCAQALLTGGAGANTSFMACGLVDELLINVEPVVIGEGIPLFSSEGFDAHLQLLDVKQLPQGILQLRYVVIK